MKRLSMTARVLVLALALLLITACALAEITVHAERYPVTKDGWYDTMEEVAVYLATFHALPDNYMTKAEAQRLGWVSNRGNLWDVAYGCSIGGDRFGNYEGLLPDKKGRKWTECDIDFDGGWRNGQRIVFSSDSLIYYTDDHYESFDEVVVVFGDAKSAGKTGKTGKAERRTIDVQVTYGECYTSHEEVAMYLHTFGELPINYIVKDDAYDLGFSAKKDNMGEVAPEFAIGGDKFGNREGLLPKKKGRQYYECDVDMVNGKRGDCRLVYSDDGLIFYTTDRYKSFEQLFGEGSK